MTHWPSLDNGAQVDRVLAYSLSPGESTSLLRVARQIVFQASVLRDCIHLGTTTQRHFDEMRRVRPSFRGQTRLGQDVSRPIPGLTPHSGRGLFPSRAPSVYCTGLELPSPGLMRSQVSLRLFPKSLLTSNRVDLCFIRVNQCQHGTTSEPHPEQEPKSKILISRRSIDDGRRDEWADKARGFAYRVEELQPQGQFGH